MVDGGWSDDQAKACFAVAARTKTNDPFFPAGLPPAPRLHADSWYLCLVSVRISATMIPATSIPCYFAKHMPVAWALHGFDCVESVELSAQAHPTSQMKSSELRHMYVVVGEADATVSIEPIRDH
jgi:hypothetical protein